MELEKTLWVHGCPTSMQQLMKKCQLQITGEIWAQTVSDTPLQNVNFYVSFLLLLASQSPSKNVSSCSRKIYDVNRILQKHKQRTLQKNCGLVKFSAVLCLFCFLFEKKSSCFTYSQKYYRRRVGFHCTFRTTHIVFFPTCFSLSTSELKLLDQRSQNFTASQGT